MLTRYGKRVGFSIAILLAAWPPFAGTAAWAGDSAKPLPSRIPRCRAEPGEIVREIARIAGEIQDPKERYRTLSSAFYPLRDLPSDQKEPVLSLLPQTAAMIKDGQFVFGARGSLILAAPEAATQVLQQIEDPRHRDAYLTDLVRQLVRTKPKQAENLITQIQGTQYRAEAMAWLARYGDLDYQKTRELLAGAADGDWSSQWPHLSYVYADTLDGFAVDDPKDVADFVAHHLEPEHAVWCFCQMGWRLLHRLNAAEAAKVVLDRAAEMIPNTPAPYKLVPRLNRCGYGKLRPERALEMFDRLVLPKIPSRELGYEVALASLATIDMETMIDRATRLAEARGWSAAEVVSGVVGRAAPGAGGRAILAWLKSTPPGPIRDASIPRLAFIVSPLPSSSVDPSPEEVREYLQALWEATRDIRDPKTKWEACCGILQLAQRTHTQVAGQVQEEFRRLFRELQCQLDEDDWRRVKRNHFGLIPEEDQRHWIQHWLEDGDRDRFSYAAKLLRQSTLPDHEKRECYRQFIRQAPGNRLALTLLAQSAASLDFEWALDLIWNVLPAVRNPDHSPCSDAEPPENADLALEWVLSEDGPAWGPSDEMLSKDELPDVLWSWAKEVPDVDRDAVLDSLGHVLLHRRQTDEALGVARLIEDRARRVKLLAEIAAELNHHGDTEEEAREQNAGA